MQAHIIVALVSQQTINKIWAKSLSVIIDKSLNKQLLFLISCSIYSINLK